MTLRSGRVVAHVLVSFTLALPAVAQDNPDDLGRTVRALDDSLFAAFNAREVDRFMTFFSDGLEFYHDMDGLSGYEHMLESARRMFGQESPLRRARVPGSTEIHPVPGYGAIQIGRHEFCHEENGVDDCGTFGFMHLWQHRHGRWRITRVFSYGH